MEKAANAAHIARMDPTTTKRLVAELRAARKRVADLEAKLTVALEVAHRIDMEFFKHRETHR